MDNIIDILGKIVGRVNPDPEREKILTVGAQEALDKLKKLSGGNEIALEYVSRVWMDIFEALQEKKIEMSITSIQVLGIVAETLLSRQMQLIELEKRRKEEKEAKMAASIRKDTH